MKTLTLKQFEKLLDAMPKQRVEEKCYSWGCMKAHYKEFIDPEVLLCAVKAFLKPKLKHEQRSKARKRA